MRAYLTDFVGDENSIDIDCGILKCNLQDAIFEKLINAPTNSDVLSPYMAMPSMSINFTARQWGYDI
jgi:hypothetical protein